MKVKAGHVGERGSGVEDARATGMQVITFYKEMKKEVSRRMR